MFKKGVVPSQGLRIIIVGCGKVGRTLVEQLGKEGHDITIVDKNRERISQVSNIYDVMGIAGNGASYKILQEAGIDDADLIIAVTGSDELNLLCCTIATQVGNCAAIARVRTPEYSQEAKYLRDKLGLALIINPELEDGTKLMDLGTRHHANILIGAVERDDEVTIPSGDFVLRKGDKLSFVGERRHTKEFFSHIGVNTHSVKNTLIIGGGKAAYYLAKQLISRGIKVKIIENSFERCEELSILLPDAVIINGDGTEQALLKEEGIETCHLYLLPV